MPLPAFIFITDKCMTLDDKYKKIVNIYSSDFAAVCSLD